MKKNNTDTVIDQIFGRIKRQVKGQTRGRRPSQNRRRNGTVKVADIYRTKEEIFRTPDYNSDEDLFEKEDISAFDEEDFAEETFTVADTDDTKDYQSEENKDFKQESPDDLFEDLSVDEKESKDSQEPHDSEASRIIENLKQHVKDLNESEKYKPEPGAAPFDAAVSRERDTNETESLSQVKEELLKQLRAEFKAEDQKIDEIRKNTETVLHDMTAITEPEEEKESLSVEQIKAELLEQLRSEIKIEEKPEPVVEEKPKSIEEIKAEILEQIKAEKEAKEAEERRRQEEIARAREEAARDMAKLKAEITAQLEAELRESVRAQILEEMRAEEKIRREAEEKARKEAEEKAKKEAELKAKKEAEEKAKKEAEEKAKKEAEEKAKREAEEKAKKEAEEKAKREAEEKAKKEAEEKAKKEAEEKAKKEAEEKARKEAEEKAKKEAEDKARKDIEERAQAESQKREEERKSFSAIFQKHEEQKVEVSAPEEKEPTQAEIQRPELGSQAERDQRKAQLKEKIRSQIIDQIKNPEKYNEETEEASVADLSTKEEVKEKTTLQDEVIPMLVEAAEKKNQAASKESKAPVASEETKQEEKPEEKEPQIGENIIPDIIKSKTVEPVAPASDIIPDIIPAAPLKGEENKPSSPEAVPEKPLKEKQTKRNRIVEAIKNRLRGGSSEEEEPEKSIPEPLVKPVKTSLVQDDVISEQEKSDSYAHDAASSFARPNISKEAVPEASKEANPDTSKEAAPETSKESAPAPSVTPPAGTQGFARPNVSRPVQPTPEESKEQADNVPESPVQPQNTNEKDEKRNRIIEEIRNKIKSQSVPTEAPKAAPAKEGPVEAQPTPEPEAAPADEKSEKRNRIVEQIRSQLHTQNKEAQKPQNEPEATAPEEKSEATAKPPVQEAPAEAPKEAQASKASAPEAKPETLQNQAPQPEGDQDRNRIIEQIKQHISEQNKASEMVADTLQSAGFTEGEPDIKPAAPEAGEDGVMAATPGVSPDKDPNKDLIIEQIKEKIKKKDNSSVVTPEDAKGPRPTFTDAAHKEETSPKTSKPAEVSARESESPGASGSKSSDGSKEESDPEGKSPAKKKLKSSKTKGAKKKTSEKGSLLKGLLPGKKKSAKPLKSAPKTPVTGDTIPVVKDKVTQPSTDPEITASETKNPTDAEITASETKKPTLTEVTPPAVEKEASESTKDSLGKSEPDVAETKDFNSASNAPEGLTPTVEPISAMAAYDLEPVEPAEIGDAYSGGGVTDFVEAEKEAAQKVAQKQEQARVEAEKEAKREKGFLERRRQAREDEDPTHGSVDVYDDLLDEEGEFSDDYIEEGNDAFPAVDLIEGELKREVGKRRFRSILKRTLGTLVVIAAAAILIATVWLPVFRIYGNSMDSTLQDGQIVFALKTREFKNGDVIAFYYGNKLLVKRVIAGPGQKVEIDDAGNVFIDEQPLSERYVTSKSLGDCNILMPYEVPENRYFVMGDHRDVSLDSRNTSVGCISDEQIVGKVTFRVWPFNKMGTIKSE